MTHDPTVLERFGAVGEVRLVFANSDRAGDVLMPDGGAEAFRARAKAGEVFRCIVPDCDSPALSIVNRGDRRHGFSHRAGAGGHAPMGVAHLWSQLLIRDWLRAAYPTATVDLEVTTEDGSRRADVMFTSASGRQAAFEIQYAALTPAAWQARHRDYVAAGITDVWLWGHLPPQFRKYRREDGQIALNPTLEAVAAAGQPILWVNPIESLIGFATTEVRRWDTEPHQVLATHDSGLFEAHPLNEFSLTVERGFASNRLRYLIDTPARIEADRERRRAEAAAAAELAAARAAENAERKAVNLANYLRRMDVMAADALSKWQNTPERKKIIDYAGGTWPEFLGLTTSGADGTVIRIAIPPEIWQARMWVKHIRARPDRTEIHAWKLQLDLAQTGVHKEIAKVAVNSWLHQLVDRFIVERTGRGHGDARFVTVNAEERRRRDARARAADEADEAAHHQWFKGVIRVIPLPNDAVPFAIVSKRTRSGANACPACTGAMNDPDSLRLGYHSRCAPEIEAKYHVTIGIRER